MMCVKEVFSVADVDANCENVSSAVLVVSPYTCNGAASASMRIVESVIVASAVLMDDAASKSVTSPGSHPMDPLMIPGA